MMAAPRALLVVVFALCALCTLMPRAARAELPILRMEDLGFNHFTSMGTLKSTAPGSAGTNVTVNLHIWLRCEAAPASAEDLVKLNGLGMVEVVDPLHVWEGGAYERPQLDFGSIRIAVTNHAGAHYDLDVHHGDAAVFNEGAERDAWLRSTLPFRVSGSANLDGSYLKVNDFIRHHPLAAGTCGKGAGAFGMNEFYDVGGILTNTVNMYATPVFFGPANPVDKIVKLIEQHVHYHHTYLNLAHTVVVMRPPEVDVVKENAEFLQLAEMFGVSILMWDDIPELEGNPYYCQHLVENLMLLYFSNNKRHLTFIDTDEYIVANNNDFKKFKYRMALSDMVKLRRMNSLCRFDFDKAFQVGAKDQPMMAYDCDTVYPTWDAFPYPKVIMRVPSEFEFVANHNAAFWVPDNKRIAEAYLDGVFIVHMVNAMVEREKTEAGLVIVESITADGQTLKSDRRVDVKHVWPGALQSATRTLQGDADEEWKVSGGRRMLR